jgi:F-type H+-transporting ATPase subunit b
MTLPIRLRLFLACVLMASSCGFVHAQDQPGARPVASAGEDTTPVDTVPAKQQQLRDENEEFRQSPTVRKMGAMMGMKPEQAATSFTVFNFLILVAVIGYGLLKMLPKTFRKRSTAIQKQLVDARTATEEASARLNSVEARLGKLDEQIASMRSQAEADSAREDQRIKASVEDEKNRILAAAQSEIQAATVQARRELQRYAAELAIEQAARKLTINAEADRLLVESFAQRLGSESGSKN